MILEAEADLVPMGPRSPLRYGRCRTDVPRTSCNPSSARLRLLRGRRPWFKVSPPARSARGMRSPGPHSPHLPQDYGRGRAGAHGSKVSAPLRSLQNRHPPDVLQPIFRKASVVAWQAPVGPRSRLCTPSSALKWGKLNYTDFVQNCILDQKERTSL